MCMPTEGNLYICVINIYLMCCIIYIYMHVIHYIMQDYGLECFDIYDVIFYLGLNQYVYFAMA